MNLQPNKEVIEFIQKHIEHKEKLEKLRELIAQYSFEETIKWGMPTYVYKGRNLIGIGAFKNHVAIWFFQGALLEDSYKVLRNAQKGKTKAMRQIKFSKLEEIKPKELHELLKGTIDNQDHGLFIKIEKKKTRITIPLELVKEFNKDPELKKSFDKLTLGRKREFTEYIHSAKREQTKTNRIQKIIPLIFENRGIY